MANSKKKISKKGPQLDVTSKITGSVFAQIVGVTRNDHFTTLEFIYVDPRHSGELVARITLPNDVANGLAKLISSQKPQRNEKTEK